MPLEPDKPLYRTPPGGFKKTRLANSCDLCIQKKIRCDSSKKASNICSNCIAYNVPCTHRNAEARLAKKKADAVQAGKPTPDNTSGIGLIHKSSERAKSFLREILSTSKPYKLPESEGSIYETIFQIALYAQDLEERLDMTARGSPSPYILQQASPGPLRLPGPQPKEEQPDIEVEISDPLRKLDLNSGSSKRSYYGKASHLMLVKTALEMMPPTKASFCLDIRRPEFWSVNPWELSEVYLKPQRKYQFPEPDLLVQLITFYFEKACASMPHLHRPSFEREVFVEGKHLYDSQFGVLVLTVCALGSRYSDDKRIFDDGCKSEHNAGWKWIRQIKPFSICSFEGEDPCVYELQALCNYILFNLETSSADVSWLLLGVGVRYAQAVGAHRRKFCSKEPTAEQELWKRAFWLLVCIDCFMSSLWGRPRATVPIDYDQEFPLEVDDEYWEPSEPGGKPFQQPKDKISRISFWGPILRLLRILGIAQRTFLALDKDALESHVWILPDEERVIMELDSDLNQWIDSVPEHLKWNPDQVDSPFFNQAATLHSMYYWITIQIHRPFIPKEGKQNTQLQYSSLAVCTNAARACVRILDVQSKRGILDVHTAQFPLFTSGMLLLLNLWGGSRLGLVGEPSKQLEDVYRCLDVLERLEKRWHIYGRLYDIISGLLSVTGLEKTRQLPYESRKRAREDDNDSSDEQRYEQRHLSPPHEESAIPNYLLELPLYPEELGRMPVHDVSLNLPHSTPFTSQDEFSYQGQAPSGSSSSIWDASLHAASSSVDYQQDTNQSVLASWAAPIHDQDTQWDDWAPYAASFDDLLRSFGS